MSKQRVNLSDGRIVAMSSVQLKAYRLISWADNQTWYAYNGISRATIRVLQNMDLVSVKWSSHTWTNYRSKRTHHQCDWVAKINPNLTLDTDDSNR